MENREPKVIEVIRGFVPDSERERQKRADEAPLIGRKQPIKVGGISIE